MTDSSVIRSEVSILCQEESKQNIYVSIEPGTSIKQYQTFVCPYKKCIFRRVKMSEMGEVGELLTPPLSNDNTQYKCLVFKNFSASAFGTTGFRTIFGAFCFFRMGTIFCRFVRTFSTAFRFLSTLMGTF